MQRYRIIDELDTSVVLGTVTGDFFELPHPLRGYLLDFLTAEESSLEAYLESRGCDEATVRDVGAALPSPKDPSSPAGELPGVAVSDLTLNLTPRCNMACVYCWNEGGLYPNRPFNKEAAEIADSKEASQPQATPAPDMTLETARAAVDRLLENRGDEDQLVVDFYGGEPLLNLEVIEGTIAYCKECERKGPVRFRYLLATNGTLLTPEVAQRLWDQGVEIAVSVDGKEGVQNRNRPMLDGSPSAPRLRENLEGMPASLRQVLVARATVTPSCADMVDTFQALRDLGFDRIELFESEEACHRITPERERAFFHTAEQYETLAAEYRRLAAFYVAQVQEGRLTRENTFFNRFFKLAQRLYYHHRVTGACPAGRAQLAAGCDGALYPCTAFIGMPDYRVGDVQTGVSSAKLAEFLAVADQRQEQCGPCEYFALCRGTGSCLNLNLYFSGDPRLPYEQGCRLFQLKMDLVMAALTKLSKACPDRLKSLLGSDPSGARGSIPKKS